LALDLREFVFHLPIRKTVDDYFSDWYRGEDDQPRIQTPRPIVSGGEIITGHARLPSARKLGMTEVP
jgi:hypothetical protein